MQHAIAANEIMIKRGRHVQADQRHERLGAFESSSTPLLNALIEELAAAPSGVGFISGCLERLISHWGVRSAVAVVDDPLLGLQLFSAGRRPFDLSFAPSEVLARGPGIHTDPTVVDAGAPAPLKPSDASVLFESDSASKHLASELAKMLTSEMLMSGMM